MLAACCLKGSRKVLLIQFLFWNKLPRVALGFEAAYAEKPGSDERVIFKFNLARLTISLPLTAGPVLEILVEHQGLSDEV